MIARIKPSFLFYLKLKNLLKSLLHIIIFSFLISNEDSYTVKLLLLMDFEIKDKEVVDYLVREFKYRDLVLHSLEMYKGQKGAKGVNFCDFIGKNSKSYILLSTHLIGFSAFLYQ